MKAVDIINKYSMQISKKELEETMLYLLNLKNRSELYLADINNFSFDRMDHIVSQRKKGIPLQYLTLNTNFYGFDFKIAEDVFIPRPETEVIIDYVVNKYFKSKDLRIVEVGTGTGVLAICLTKLLSNCRIIATDVSFDSIRIASENATLNGVRPDILFAKSNSVDSIKKEGFFDLLVSNPPYIAFSQESLISDEVKREPKEALFGGIEGYEFTLKMIKEGSSVIKKGGEMVIEIDPNHRSIYEEMLIKEKLSFIKDLEGKDRVMVVGF